MATLDRVVAAHVMGLAFMYIQYIQICRAPPTIGTLTYYTDHMATK